MNYFKSVLFIVIVIIFFSGFYSVSAQATSSEDWTQYRLNSQNNPVISSHDKDIFDKTLKTNNEIRSTPVVVGNRVFVGNHDSGDVSAYNLETGELQWHKKAPNWVHSEMIDVDGQIFVGYGNRFFQKGGIRGTGKSGLLSLDAATGEILWDFKTDGEVMPTPAFYHDTVYITTGDKHLYGIDPDHGKEKWSLNLGSVISMSAPNIKDGILYVGGSSPYVFFAVDLDAKKIKWKTPFEKVTSGLDDVPPVISDEGLVYTTGVKDTTKPLSVRKVYNQDGLLPAYKQAIKKTIGNLINKPPRTHYNHTLYAMDSDSGEMKWEQSLGIGKMVSNNKSGAPMIYNHKVFLGSPITESFYAFDAKIGEKLWDYKSNVNKAPPVADDDVVYFTDTKGLVYGFDTESGKLLGKKLLEGKLAPSGPIIVNDHLMVGSQDHNVYALPTKDILDSDDAAEDDGSDKGVFSYVFFIYVLPIAIVAAVVVLLLYLVRRIKRRG